MTIKKIKLYLFIIIFSLFLSKLNAKDFQKLEIGNIEAKVVIKIFSSLTCPHCADLHKKIFKNLDNEFIQTNLVRFQHHGFPLDLAALNAEKLLICIDGVRNRLNFLDEIYEKQNAWASGNDINSINLKLSKIAKNYGLNDDKIATCFENENLEDKILEDRIKSSKEYTIQSTPTIFINEKKYDGDHNYKEIRKAIKKLL